MMIRKLADHASLAAKAIIQNSSIKIEQGYMLKHKIPVTKLDGKKAKGLTPEQRKHLEDSMRENDELMKCLAEM